MQNVWQESRWCISAFPLSTSAELKISTTYVPIVSQYMKWWKCMWCKGSRGWSCVENWLSVGCRGLTRCISLASLLRFMWSCKGTMKRIQQVHQELYWTTLSSTRYWNSSASAYGLGAEIGTFNCGYWRLCYWHLCHYSSWADRRKNEQTLHKCLKVQRTMKRSQVATVER